MTIFWSEIGSGFGEQAAHPHHEFPGIHPPGLIYIATSRTSLLKGHGKSKKYENTSGYLKPFIRSLNNILTATDISTFLFIRRKFFTLASLRKTTLCRKRNLLKKHITSSCVTHGCLCLPLANN